MLVGIEVVATDSAVAFGGHMHDEFGIAAVERSRPSRVWLRRSFAATVVARAPSWR